MSILNFFAVILFLTLLAETHSHSNNHNHHHDSTDWIKFLPDGVEQFLKNQTTELPSIKNENHKETTTTGVLSSSLIDVNGTSNSSVTPITMSGTTYSDSSRNQVIFIPIGSIVFLILLCCCCIKVCCRGRETQGMVIQTQQPQPFQQVTVQHIHAGQPPAPPPSQYQPVYNVVAPPPQHQPVYNVGAPPPQYQPAYNPPQPPSQDPWSPHQPMNPHMEQYPPEYRNDPYNPSAPPTYGKY